MSKFLFLILGLLILIFGIDAAEGASINTRITTVSIWDLVIFEGEGFHRLHNVEITISKGDVVLPALLTQTTDRGDLFMPFIISHLDSGKYDVFATDKIHTATTSFEI